MVVASSENARVGALVGVAVMASVGPEDGTTMGQRRAVAKTIARRYRGASGVEKGRILDELCRMTGWHRNHARKALAGALTPRLIRPRPVRLPMYGEAVVEALRFCWAVMGALAGKRMAPFLAELVIRLRLCGELRVDDDTAAMLSRMSASTIDRRLAGRGSRARGGPAHRWVARRALGRLVDRLPGGSAVHGLLASDVEEILALILVVWPGPSRVLLRQRPSPRAVTDRRPWRSSIDSGSPGPTTSAV